MNHSELAQLAASMETSMEVMEVIADKASGDKDTMLKIHEDGDKELEVLSFADTEEDELHWGEETIYRYSEDVRNFVEKHIHTKADGHDYMPKEIKERYPVSLASAKEWVLETLDVRSWFINLTKEDELALDNKPELIAECAAKYIVSK